MLSPFRLHVIPAKAGIHGHGSASWSEDRVRGFRIKSGMTARTWRLSSRPLETEASAKPITQKTACGTSDQCAFDHKTVGILATFRESKHGKMSVPIFPARHA